MSVLQRILALVLKEIVVILKDPKSRFVVIGPPLIQFFLFGYAATYDITNVRYAVLDQARSTESRELLSRLRGSDNFQLVRSLSSDRQIEPVITNQEARMVVHIGPEFSRRLHQGRPAELQVIVDGRNSNVTLVAVGYIGTIVQEYNQELAARGTTDIQGPGLVLVQRAWFNQNLRSRWFIVSALGESSAWWWS